MRQSRMRCRISERLLVVGIVPSLRQRSGSTFARPCLNVTTASDCACFEQGRFAVDTPTAFAVRLLDASYAIRTTCSSLEDGVRVSIRHCGILRYLTISCNGRFQVVRLLQYIIVRFWRETTSRARKRRSGPLWHYQGNRVKARRCCHAMTIAGRAGLTRTAPWFLAGRGRHATRQNALRVRLRKVCRPSFTASGA